MRMNNHINMVYLHHSSPSDLSFIMVGVSSLLHLLSFCNNCVSFIQQIVLSTEITMYNIYSLHTSFSFSQFIFILFKLSTNISIQYRTHCCKHILSLNESAKRYFVISHESHIFYCFSIHICYVWLFDDC